MASSSSSSTQFDIIKVVNHNGNVHWEKVHRRTEEPQPLAMIEQRHHEKTGNFTEMTEGFRPLSKKWDKLSIIWYKLAINGTYCSDDPESWPQPKAYFMLASGLIMPSSRAMSHTKAVDVCKKGDKVYIPAVYSKHTSHISKRRNTYYRVWFMDDIDFCFVSMNKIDTLEKNKYYMLKMIATEDPEYGIQLEYNSHKLITDVVK